MKISKKIKYIILILFFFLPFGRLIFNRYDGGISSVNQIMNPLLRSSESVSPIFINGSGKGVGAHNWSWVEIQTWFDGGNGSWSNPYLIQDISISGSSNSCFEIVNSDKFFILDNCDFLWGGPSPNAGLKMTNVNNSKIVQNYIQWSEGNGINLISCNNINISGTTSRYNEEIGLYCSNVHNILLDNYNIIEGNLFDGVYIEDSSDISFLDSYINSNDMHGCYFELVNNVNLRHNEIMGNNYEGLILQLINDSYIRDNTINYNGDTGLDIAGMNNLIIDNSIHSNYGNGVYCHWYDLLDSNQNNTFRNNQINYNAWTGLTLEVSYNNSLIENHMNYNRAVGLELSYSDDNNVTGNFINNNLGNWGIYIQNSDNNSIIGNQIIGNKGTISQSGSTGNIILDNIYEILENLFIEISEQTFTTDYFNLTFFIFNESNSGIIVDSIQITWNATDTSTAIENHGMGFYFISLTPITVSSGEKPILLNMTVNANGYAEKHFELKLAVDPDTIEKESPPETTPSTPPTIPGFDILIVLLMTTSATLIEIFKKSKSKK